MRLLGVLQCTSKYDRIHKGQRLLIFHTSKYNHHVTLVGLYAIHVFRRYDLLISRHGEILLLILSRNRSFFDTTYY